MFPFVRRAQVIDIKIFVTVIHLRFPCDNGIDNDTQLTHPFMPHRIEHTTVNRIFEFEILRKTMNGKILHTHADTHMRAQYN